MKNWLIIIFQKYSKLKINNVEDDGYKYERYKIWPLINICLLFLYVTMKG